MGEWGDPASEEVACFETVIQAPRTKPSLIFILLSYEKPIARIVG